MPHAGGRQAETRRPRPPPQAAYRLMPFASREHAERRETSVPRSREILQSTQGDHRMPETAKLMTRVDIAVALALELSPKNGKKRETNV